MAVDYDMETAEVKTPLFFIYMILFIYDNEKLRNFFRYYHAGHRQEI